MFKKLSTLVIAGAILISILGFTGSKTALAATAGMGPDSALAPAGEWKPLAVGQETWYTFDYAGDGSQITARMGVDPASSATFGIWTPAQLQQWAQGDTVNPVGRGAADNALGGDLVWSGNFKTPGTYYVVVDQAGSVPSNYALTVGGSGVTLPVAKVEAPAAKPAAATEAAEAATTKTAEVAAPAKTAPAKAAAAAAPAKTGTGPEDALALSGKWMPLAIGQETWYAFQYAGDGSQTTIQMSVDPAGSAGFKVLTPAQEQQWAQGDTVNPVGRGSVDNARSGDLVWTGSFNTPGTYYVVVDQIGSVPSNYSIWMN